MHFHKKNSGLLLHYDQQGSCMCICGYSIIGAGCGFAIGRLIGENFAPDSVAIYSGIGAAGGAICGSLWGVTRRIYSMACGALFGGALGFAISSFPCATRSDIGLSFKTCTSLATGAGSIAGALLYPCAVVVTRTAQCCVRRLCCCRT